MLKTKKRHSNFPIVPEVKLEAEPIPVIEEMKIVDVAAEGRGHPLGNLATATLYTLTTRG